jgi:hypothetical protein
LMERFDCPDVSMVTAKRTTTITAIQALAQMNNPFVLKQAEHLAERIQGMSGTPDEQVRLLFRVLFQREPQTEEKTPLKEYLGRNGLPNLCRLMLNTNELMFID